MPLEGVILGNNNLSSNILETVFKLLNNVINRPKFAVYASRIYASHCALVVLSCSIYVTPYVLIKLLQVLKSLVVCYDEANPLEYFDNDDTSTFLPDLKDKNKFSADLELI